MQKCSQCGFNSVSVRRVADDNGVDRGSVTLCTNCNAMLRDDVDDVSLEENDAD